MKDKILSLLITTLSYFVPKKKTLVIFGSGDSKQFQGNPKYLFLYLNTVNSNIDSFWSSKNKEQYNVIEERGLPVIDRYSFKGFWQILRARYLVIEKSSYDIYYSKSIFGRFNFIQTWHATPFKKVGVDAYDHKSADWNYKLIKNKILHRFLKKIKFYSRLKYKKIVSTSEVVSLILQGAFENKNTVITGYPRNDVLFNKKLLFNDYSSFLKTEKYHKIILYAPTFRDNKHTVMPFSKELIKFNKKLKEKKYLLVIKKHPWEKKFVVPNGLSNVQDVSKDIEDIQELLPHVDLLITDFSSTFYDFMLMKKDVIFFVYDFEDYINNCRGIYFDYFDELQGPFARDEKQLFDLILNDDWTLDKSYRYKYTKVLNKYNHFKDGNSSQRLLHILFPDWKKI